MKRCDKCRFFIEGPKEMQGGWCHLVPPDTHPADWVKTNAEHTVVRGLASHFRTVAHDMWCGQFKRRFFWHRKK